jgi:hypothetical protein
MRITESAIVRVQRPACAKHRKPNSPRVTPAD